ncbi:MAG: hypothetical protein IIW18_01850, partial [Oscillospiraceae bacterium]|nr:hypothetical protein [Oscillospiraceae bacterium]
MRILATFCFSFAAGSALAQYVLPHNVLFPAAFAAALCALAVRFLQKDRWRILLILLGLALSFVHSALYNAVIFAPNAALVGTEQTLTMELCAKPEETAYGARAEVSILD